MGFTAGLYRYPIYDKQKLSSKDYFYISEYLAYQTGEWAQEHFKSADEYARYCINAPENYTPPSQGAIDFYISKAKIDEFGYKQISEEMCSWCSNGSGKIYEWFYNLPQATDDMGNCVLTIRLDAKDIANFAKFCWEYIDKHMPQSCTIDRAFKFIDGEDDEPDIKLIKCDGIECKFENGVTKRFETNSEYGCEFFIPKEYYDEFEMYGYMVGLEGALNILATTDFSKEFIEYSGGW